MSRVLRAELSPVSTWPLPPLARGLNGQESSVLPRERSRAPDQVTSSGAGSLELVDFSPVGALKESVAATQRVQPKLLLFKVIIEETAL